MGGFSRKQDIIDAEKIIIEYDKKMARLGGVGNSDYKILHPDEVRDALLDHPNYAKLTARVKKECETYQKKRKERNEKIGRAS